MVSFGFTHFLIIVWILIKGPNGPNLGRFAQLLRELRDLTHSEWYLLFHYVAVQKIGYHSDGNNLASIIDNFGNFFVFHTNHILSVDLENNSTKTAVKKVEQMFSPSNSFGAKLQILDLVNTQ